MRVRMSAAGYCPRRLTAILMGAEGAGTPKWLGESAAEGNWHEARLKEELRSLGCQVADEQTEVKLVVPNSKDLDLIGHIDGRVKFSKELLMSPLFTSHYINCSSKDLTDEFFAHFCLLEVKTFSYLEHQRWMEEGFDNYFYHYAVQHTLYREALGERGVTTLISKDRSGGSRNVFFIGHHLVELPVLYATLAKVVEDALAGDLYPAEYDASRLECRRCEFRISQCAGKTYRTDEASMLIAATDYLAGAAQEKEGKALKDEAREALLNYSKVVKQLKWMVGSFLISHSQYSRESISSKVVRDVINNLRGLISLNPTVYKEALEPVVVCLEQAITVSPVDRINVSALDKESE